MSPKSESHTNAGRESLTWLSEHRMQGAGRPPNRFLDRRLTMRELDSSIGPYRRPAGNFGPGSAWSLIILAETSTSAPSPGWRNFYIAVFLLSVVAFFAGELWALAGAWSDRLRDEGADDVSDNLKRALEEILWLIVPLLLVFALLAMAARSGI